MRTQKERPRLGSFLGNMENFDVKTSNPGSRTLFSLYGFFKRGSDYKN